MKSKLPGSKRSIDSTSINPQKPSKPFKSSIPRNERAERYRDTVVMTPGGGEFISR